MKAAMGAAWRLVLLGWLAVSMIGGAALGQDAPARHQDRPAPVSPPEGGDGEDGADATPVEPPDSDAGRELAWVLGVINGADPGDIASHFTPRYLQIYPVEKIREVLTTLREKTFGGAKVELVRVEEEDLNRLALSGTLKGENTRRFFIVFLSLHDQTKKIAGLYFNPAGFSSVGKGAEAPDEVESDVGGSVLFGAYEIVGTDGGANKPGEEQAREGAAGGAPAKSGDATPATEDEVAPDPSRRILRVIYEFGRAEDGAIAGLMRLWLLDAVGSRVAGRALAWDQPVTVKDEYKCIPGGETSGMEAGQTLALGEMVRRMCASADTTAMEHVFRLVGREEVEKVVERDTPRTAGARLPLLSPREMFALKLTDRDALVTDFVTDLPEQKRAKLEAGGEIAGLEPQWAKLEDWTEPRLLDKVGYFALPETLAATMAHLKTLSERPGCEHLLDGLAAGVGIELDASRWPRAYGAWGAEPGVAAAALMMRRDDGRWFVVVAIWNNKDKTLEGERLDNLMRGGVKTCDSVGKAAPAPEDPGAVH